MIRANRISRRGSTTTTRRTTDREKDSVTTTENTAPEVIEGEIVDQTEGPQADAPAPEADAAPAPAAGEDSSSGEEPGTEVAEVSDLTEKQARTLTEKIKKGLNGAADTNDRLNKQVGDAAELMTEAYQKKIWLALGEESWAEFVNKELGEVRVRLERSVRQTISYALNTGPAHMPSRVIAPILGVDQKTVVNDLRQVKRELGVTTTTPVVGQDGKVYTETSVPAVPRQRRAKPIEDRFAAAIEKADAAVGDLTALSVEDGWDDAVGAVRKTHKAAVARLIDSLKGVQDRLTSQ